MERDLYSLSAYQYDLPQELIAQKPLEKRDSSRLMVVDRKSGKISITSFPQLIEYLNAGDVIVFNDTKVIHSRLIGNRPSGGTSEVFLTKMHADGTWDALVRPGRKLPVGATVQFKPGFYCEIIQVYADGSRRVKFHAQGEIDRLLEECGKLPLPLYIDREPGKEDLVRYQTVYASNPGSIAAPTAGLHFSEMLLGQLRAKGVQEVKLTLHVGLGTFLPVKSDDIRHHAMHSERYLITEEASSMINQTKRDGKRRLCVGTTCCRTIESASDEEGAVLPGSKETNIFIYPGYKFKNVDSLLTNFHLPGSTLLMLVSAFGGYDLIKEAYSRAVENKMRFYSYGDAMLIL